MCAAVKEAAVQRRHNLYRDSIVLSNSDPSLHLLGESPSIDWAGEYGAAQEETDGTGEDGEGQNEESQKTRRMKQVVSMIQVEGSTLPSNIESCIEVPGVKDIPEENGEEGSTEISENPPDLSNGSVSKEVQPKPEEQHKGDVTLKAETTKESVEAMEEKREDIQPEVEGQTPSTQEVVEETLQPPPPPSEEIPTIATGMSPEGPAEETADFPPPPHNDSGFQSPTSEEAEEAPSSAVPQQDEEPPEKSAAAADPETTTTEWWSSSVLLILHQVPHQSQAKQSRLSMTELLSACCVFLERSFILWCHIFSSD